MEYPEFDEDPTHGVAVVPIVLLTLGGGLVIAILVWWL